MTIAESAERLLVLAARASDLDEVTDALIAARRLDEAVEVIALRDDSFRARGWAARALWRTHLGQDAAGLTSLRVAMALRSSPRVAQAVAKATTLVALGMPIRGVERAVRGVRRDLPVLGHEELPPLLEGIKRRQLARVLRLADDLVRARDHHQARTLIDQGAAEPPESVAAVLAALGVAMDLSDHGASAADLQAAAQGAATAADEAWVEGRVPEAVVSFSAAMRLLLHPALHLEVAESALYADPDSFLAPLRTSRMLAELTRPLHPGAPAGADCAGPAEGGGAAPRSAARVLVLTGSYPRFAGPMVDALRAVPGIEVRALSLGATDKVFSWLGVNTRALALRVAQHPGGEEALEIAGTTRVTPSVFDGIDVIVADWADRGAMWASATAPAGVRLVVRLHGADVLSPWVHLIDWSRVADVVFVSAPLRDLARAVVGDRLDHARLHVIEHGVDPRPFDGAVDRRPEDPVPAGRERTLGMIGWGRVVKDPMWTLDVLEELVREDPTWRLVLVGHPLDRQDDHHARAYGAELRRRLEGRLAAHIRLVAQTDDVPAHAAGMGFIISSSLRESFHLGLVEGVLAGAVPVVRDWPVYRGRSGPRDLYPAEWVVDDAAAAVARIRALGGSEAHARASARARSEARRRFAPDRFAQDIRRVVLGR